MRDKDGNTPLRLAVKSVNSHATDPYHSYRLTDYYGFDLPGYDYDSKETKVAKALIKYTLLRSSDAENPGYLPQDLDSYWGKCKAQVEKMKREEVYGGVTFYDVLTARSGKLVSYVRNCNADYSWYRSMFPVYRDDIYYRYQKGIRRMHLLNDVDVMYVNHSNGSVIPVPEELCRKIAEYLRDRDIENFNEAVTPEQQGAVVASDRQESSDTLAACDPGVELVSGVRSSSPSGSGGSNNGDQPGPSSRLSGVQQISRSQSLNHLHSNDKWY